MRLPKWGGQKKGRVKTYLMLFQLKTYFQKSEKKFQKKTRQRDGGRGFHVDKSKNPASFKLLMRMGSALERKAV